MRFGIRLRKLFHNGAHILTMSCLELHCPCVSAGTQIYIYIAGTKLMTGCIIGQSMRTTNAAISVARV